MVATLRAPCSGGRHSNHCARAYASRASRYEAWRQRLGVTYQAVHNCGTAILRFRSPTSHPTEFLSDNPQKDGTFIPFSPPSMQISVADEDFLQGLLAALLLEGVPRQTAEEARDLATRLLTEAHTPPDRAIGVSSAAEAVGRSLRQRKS